MVLKYLLLPLQCIPISPVKCTSVSTTCGFTKGIQVWDRRSLGTAPSWCQSQQTFAMKAHGPSDMWLHRQACRHNNLNYKWSKWSAEPHSSIVWLPTIVQNVWNKYKDLGQKNKSTTLNCLLFTFTINPELPTGGSKLHKPIVYMDYIDNIYFLCFVRKNMCHRIL